MRGFFKVRARAILLSCIVLLILSALLPVVVSAVVCDDKNTPRFSLPQEFILREDELFEYDINATNIPDASIIYSLSLLNSRITGLKMSTGGVLSLMPGREDSGSSTIAVLAVNGGCVAAKLLELKILSKPVITSYSPFEEAIGINQTATVEFKIKIELDNPKASATIKWYLDSELILGSEDKESLSFTPGYNRSGNYNISVVITASYNLSITKSWLVEVAHINRAPVLTHEVPAFLLVNNTASGAYNLNDYFMDPNKGKLSFSYRQVFPEYEPILSQAEVNVSLLNDGYVTYAPQTGTRGVAYFVFIAKDLFGLSVESNNVKIDVISQFDLGKLPVNGGYEEYCGNLVCGAFENCTNCPYDCGPCVDAIESGCSPIWNCTGWSVCYPQGYQIRVCVDLVNCGDNRTMPSEAKRCRYEATCDDGLKNGIEDGVDCGGPCDVCPNCSDNIRNQGEDGVDCGGPCIPCPSCTDQLKNQNESDVDCGGTCDGCAGGMKCDYNHDCESFKCVKEVCAFASCEDSIKNQGEEGIDCDGPCLKVCGNCSDGIKNQGEGDVDCGGRCRPCPSCDDGKKNGDERYVDCGGDCKKCEFHDFLIHNLVWIVMLALLVIMIVGGVLSYFVLILARPEKAKRLYNNNTFFLFMTGMNRFCRNCRKVLRKSPAVGADAVKNYLEELQELARRPFSNKELYDTIIRMYSSIFSLPPGFDDKAFFSKIHESKVPPFLKVLLVGFYKKAGILTMGTFVADEERESFLTEFRFLIAELGKA